MITHLNNCPILERTGDGKVAGRCWFYMKDGHTCPRHGDVSEAANKYRETGKLTDEATIPDSEAKAFVLTGNVRETTTCAQCGAAIVVREELDDGRIASEYRDIQGRCLNCSGRRTTPNRSTRPRPSRTHAVNNSCSLIRVPSSRLNTVT